MAQHCCPPKVIIDQNQSSYKLGQGGSCLFRKINTVATSRNKYRIHISKSNITNICDTGITNIYKIDKTSPEFIEYKEEIKNKNNSNNCVNRNRFNKFFI